MSHHADRAIGRLSCVVFPALRAELWPGTGDLERPSIRVATAQFAVQLVSASAKVESVEL
jgi:hypothetical protein